MLVIKNVFLRRLLKYLVPLVLMPIVVAGSAFAFAGQNYALAILLLTVLALALFITGFEKKQTGTRRLIIVAVMVALSVAGRFIPLFKPITALTIITAIYLGGEAGFLVGALAAVISNFYFGQGPWTPFQMFSWGLIGLIAGFLATPLRRSRLLLLLYGLLSGVAYSFIMDIWTVMWYNGSFNTALYLTALATAIPYTIIYAVSNLVFLWFLAKPFGDKLERLKLKYGI